jgi:hypothetical protein
MTFYQIKTTYSGGKMTAEYTDLRICERRPENTYEENGENCSYFDWLTPAEICTSFPELAKKYHFNAD